MTTVLELDVRERRVLQAARIYTGARREFAEMRVSGRHSGMAVAAARRRRDHAADALTVAVEELDR